MPDEITALIERCQEREAMIRAVWRGAPDDEDEARQQVERLSLADVLEDAAAALQRLREQRDESLADHAEAVRDYAKALVDVAALRAQLRTAQEALERGLWSSHP